MDKPTDSPFDDFIDDEYRSRPYIKKAERERATMPFFSVEHYVSFCKSIIEKSIK